MNFIETLKAVGGGVKLCPDQLRAGAAALCIGIGIIV
jgi:hypothetical protein